MGYFDVGSNSAIFMPKKAQDFINPLEVYNPFKAVEKTKEVGKDIGQGVGEWIYDNADGDNIFKPVEQTKESMQNGMDFSFEQAKKPDVGSTDGSSNKWGDDPVATARGQRDEDIQAGIKFGSQYFGEGNPAMKAILDQRRERALGLNEREIQLMRSRASEGINRQMATGMRGLRGVQATSGVRGGAAAAQALPVLRQATDARGTAERDIALADMARRSTELNGYEQSLTNERSGLVGTGMGFAALGSGDRASQRESDLTAKGLDTYKQMVADAKTPEERGWLEKLWKHYGDVFNSVGF